MDVWRVLLGVAGGLLLAWLALVATLYVLGRRETAGEPTRLRDLLRLVPDVLRLLRRLAADPEVPRRVRWLLAALAVYLAMPIDLVPDFIPVAGYADDAIVVALALRLVVRTAGVDAVDRYWPGTPSGLEALKRLTGLG